MTRQDAPAAADLASEPVADAVAEEETAPVAMPVTSDPGVTAEASVIAATAEPVRPLRAVAGDVAVDVARQLADPVRALRDRLGLVVDQLERHVATSTGPTPFPWRMVQTLRHDLAAAYLEATALARRLDELDRALVEDPPGWFDAAAAVELGLHLAGHHLTAGIEVLIDLGNTPPARGASGSVALLVAQLVAISARSARAVPGSTVSVRVTPEAGYALVTIADNGAGADAAAALGELARSVIGPWGGTVDAASVPGAGCTFELCLPALER